MSSYGHVASVTKVMSDASFEVTEMGCDSWNGVRTTVYPPNSASGFIYGGSVGQGYYAAYVSQNFSGDTWEQRQVNSTSPITFTSRWNNQSKEDWVTDPTSNKFVELVAVDSKGDLLTNFTNYPLDRTGWRTLNAPINTATGVARPGESKNFTFSARVKVGIPAGQYKLYFRLRQKNGWLFRDWPGMYFPVEVVTGSGIPLAPLATLAGDLTGDAKADVVLVCSDGTYLYASSGTGLSAPVQVSPWGPTGMKSLLADVLGRGSDQLVSWGSGGVYCQIYDPATTPKLGNPILIGSWSPDPATMRVKAGDVDNNGTEDLVVQTSGQLLALRSWWSGSYDQQLHLQTWSNWSSYPYPLLVGDFNPDGQADVLFSIPGDRTYAKFSTGSAFGGNTVVANWAFSATDSIVTGYFTTDHRVGLMRTNVNGCEVLVPVGSGYVGPFLWSAWSPGGTSTLVGDVNGDGLDDVIGVFPELRKISVLLNDAGQRFSGPFTWYTGSGSTQPMKAQPVSERQVQSLSFTVTQNPVMGTAHFRLTLPEPSEISVEIYDVSGRKVGTVATGVYQSGTHMLPWNSRGHPAGMYLVRFSTKGVTQTHKFVRLN